MYNQETNMRLCTIFARSSEDFQGNKCAVAISRITATTTCFVFLSLLLYQILLSEMVSHHY